MELKKLLLVACVFIGGTLEVGRKEKDDLLVKLNINSPCNHHQTLHEMHLMMQEDKFYEHKIVCLQ